MVPARLKLAEPTGRGTAVSRFQAHSRRWVNVAKGERLLGPSNALVKGWPAKRYEKIVGMRRSLAMTKWKWTRKNFQRNKLGKCRA